MTANRSLPIRLLILAGGWCLAAKTTLPAEVLTVPRAELLDRIRGGWAGQMIGDIQGLPFEFKYKDRPGPLPDFVPHLPRCPSDDDTDVEWVNLMAMDRLGLIEIPYPDLAREWLRSINRKIYVSNKRARDLMATGILPPWTSHPALNPHARYNLSGQFCVESYGLIAPAMPPAAARIARHYARIAVRGEPIQATAFWTAMVSLAFVERDLETMVQLALEAVDPQSQHAEMVRDVLAWHRQTPDDWQAIRARIQAKYRDERKWNMNATVTNGGLVLTALLCGKGDVVQTLRLSFALGYDADCNAATCGTILGVLHGAKAMEAHRDWKLPVVFENVTRDGLPAEQTMEDIVAMTARLAERVIAAEGGRRDGEGETAVYRIPLQPPVLLERLEMESRETTDSVLAALAAAARKQLDSESAVARSFAAIYLATHKTRNLTAGERRRVEEILAATVVNDAVLAGAAETALKKLRP